MPEKTEKRGGARRGTGVKIDPKVGKRLKVSITMTSENFEWTRGNRSATIEKALALYRNAQAAAAEKNI